MTRVATKQEGEGFIATEKGRDLKPMSVGRGGKTILHTDLANRVQLHSNALKDHTTKQKSLAKFWLGFCVALSMDWPDWG